MTGTLVKIINQNKIWTDLYSENYSEYFVEGISRFKILDVVSEQRSGVIMTCDVVIYNEEGTGNHLLITKIYL
jgi:hypothetical protein